MQAISASLVTEAYAERVGPSGRPELPEDQVRALRVSREAPQRLEQPAIVVLEPEGDSEASSLSDLVDIGKLQDAVTDVDVAFPRFAQLTGGRMIAELRVIGFAMPDGTIRPVAAAHSSGGENLAVDAGASQPPLQFAVGGVGSLATAWAVAANSMASCLPVAFEAKSGRSYIFAQNVEGDWLLPVAPDGETLVLAALPAPVPHLDALSALENMAPILEKTGEAVDRVVAPARPLIDSAHNAVSRSLERTGEVVDPVLDATGAAISKSFEQTSAAVKPLLDGAGDLARTTGDTLMKPVLDATGAAMGKSVEAAREGLEASGAPALYESTIGKGFAEAAAPAWQLTKENVSFGLAATGAAGMGLLEASKDHVGKGLDVTDRGLSSTPVISPLYVGTRDHVRRVVDQVDQVIDPACKHLLGATEQIIGKAAGALGITPAPPVRTSGAAPDPETAAAPIAAG